MDDRPKNSLNNTIKNALRPWIPPAVLSRLNQARPGAGPAYEYLPGGWAAFQGWETASFATSAEEARAAALVWAAQAPANTFEQVVRLAYEVALRQSVSGKNSLSILDWGGGYGHYLHLSRHLLPETMIVYTCRDVEPIAREAQAAAGAGETYVSAEGCLDARHDFVLASSSLQYADEWRATASRLAQATAGYLFITRMPLTERSEFVYKQHAYETSFCAWAIPERLLICQVEQAGLCLIRDFDFYAPTAIPGAPEPLRHRGLLFRRTA